jgi:hypothetical protein
MTTPPVRPPAHLLHIGPWANNITWRAVPNKGLMPTVHYPPEPLYAMTDTTEVSFTLNRDAPSEANITYQTDCDNAILIDEMVTDLWWRRRNFATGVTENIGRFQARDVQTSCEAGRVSCQVQWHDYRGVLEGRIINNAGHSATAPGAIWPANTQVTTILRDILPTNAGVDLTALNNFTVGTIGLPLGYEMGDKVPEVISKIQKVSPLFDWAVELVGDAAVLRLYAGGRGHNKGVTLVDKGRGYSPMRKWDRRTNSEDFATYVIVTGVTGSREAIYQNPTIPQGQHDYREDDNTLADVNWIQYDADYILAQRNHVTTSWQVELQPGVWQGRSHIDLGDEVRLVVQLGKDLIDERKQVEQITVDVPSSGIENVTLTLGFPRPNPDPRSKFSALNKLLTQIRSRKKK